MTNEPRAIADVTIGLVLATVDIKATPERVFQALTSPDEVPRWWGSADMYRTTSMIRELRPGGAWQTAGIGADGSEFSVSGTYKVVQPPLRLDLTWKPSWESFESLVSYNLMAIDGGTRVTIRHTGFGENAASCAGHAYGWERVLGWLAAYIRG